ncbi:MAG: tetratricopeptide repeat protein, partial [Sphingomonadaceae bacterium]
ASARIEDALVILERVLDDTSPFLAHALALKGQILFGKKDLRGARSALDRAVAIYRKGLDGPSYVIGISEVYLALIASEQGESAAALAYLDDAKANYDASYTGIHPNHGDLLVNRARVLARAGRRSEAAADCASGLAILVDTLGRDHGFTRENQAVCEEITR